MAEEGLDTWGWVAVCLVGAGFAASWEEAAGGDTDGVADEAGEVERTVVVAAGLFSVFA